MQTITFTQAKDQYQAGDIATVENNIAHRYIDMGVAELARRDNGPYASPKNRMASIERVKNEQSSKLPNRHKRRS